MLISHRLGASVVLHLYAPLPCALGKRCAGAVPVMQRMPLQHGGRVGLYLGDLGSKWILRHDRGKIIVHLFVLAHNAPLLWLKSIRQLDDRPDGELPTCSSIKGGCGGAGVWRRLRGWMDTDMGAGYVQYFMWNNWMSSGSAGCWSWGSLRGGEKSLRDANINERSRGRSPLPGHGTFST